MLSKTNPDNKITTMLFLFECQSCQENQEKLASVRQFWGIFNAALASEVKGFYGQTKPQNYELNKTGESSDEIKWAA